MILFFGSRPGKRETKKLPLVQCPHCEQMGSLTLVSQANHAHIFWLPLFVIDRAQYVECSHCKRVYFREEFSPEMERAAKTP